MLPSRESCENSGFHIFSSDCYGVGAITKISTASSCHNEYPQINDSGRVVWHRMSSSSSTSDSYIYSADIDGSNLVTITVSPCVDVGSDTAENLGMDDFVTRTDGVPDTGRVDMGYHTFYELRIDSITRSDGDITIHWNAKASVSYTVQHSTETENWTDVPVGETDHWTDYGVSETTRLYRVHD